MLGQHFWGLSTAIIGVAAAVVVLPPVAIPQTVDERAIAAIAKAMTVIINGQNPGSGIIIAKNGTTYSVLTAKHVVATADEYEIVTPDGISHSLDYNTVRKLPELDLAIAQFNSGENYPIAVMGDSDTTTEGTAIYISGWPHPGQAITQRIFQITSGKLSGRAIGAAEDGYELVYTNVTRSGMSGGAVFDESGLLVGIHGRAEGEPIYNSETGDTVDIKSGFNLGIPINTFLAKALEMGINLPYARFNFFSGKELKADSEYYATALILSPDSRSAIAGYADGIVRWWDLSTGEVTKTWTGSDRNPIEKLLVTPDGQYLASLHDREGGEPDAIQIWDMNSGKVQRTLTGNSAMAIAPDGQLLATGNSDRDGVELWELRSGNRKATLPLEDGLYDLAFSPDGQLLITADIHQGILWNWATQKQLKTLQYPLDIPLKHGFRCIAIDPDNTTLATALFGYDGNAVGLWDLQTGELLKELSIGDTNIKLNCSLFFDVSGQRLALAGGYIDDEESVVMWNVQTGKRLFFPEATRVAAFSPDGQTFVTGSYDPNGYADGAQFLTIWRSRP